MDLMFLLLMLLSSLIVVAVSRKFKLQSEIIVIMVGTAISFIPFLPQLRIDGELLLTLILPPILYSGARSFGLHKFSSMKRPIVSLGVALVIVTALSVALIAYQMIPFLGIGPAIIIGALVAPTDATSAITIGKKLKLPDRILTIMTGESLINDAAALTLYTLGLTLALSPADEPVENVLLLFTYQLGVGLLIGVAVGVITHLVRKLLQDPSLITVFSAIIPYTAYLIATQVEASGVIAVVICGFIVERSAFEANSAVRLQERSFWLSIDTLFETLVFGYMGLQVKYIFSDLAQNGMSPLSAILLTAPLLLAVVLIRPIWIFSTSFAGSVIDRFSRIRVRKLSKTLYTRFPNLDARKRMRLKIIRRHRVLQTYKISASTTRDNIILSWCGMRGVVSIAIAASAPSTLNRPGETLTTAFILVVGLIVAFSTLILQAPTLPILARKLKVEDVRHVRWLEQQNRIAHQLMDDSAQRVLEGLKETTDDLEITKIQDAWDRFRHPLSPNPSTDFELLTGIFYDIVETQRADLIDATNSGEIDPDVAKEILARLDRRQELLK
jgi:CPA1 family monovalent cation:H+ antiporter